MRKYLPVLFFVAAACTGHRYAQTTNVTAPSKPAACSFDVLSTRPDRPYDEIGVLDARHASNASTDAGSFRDSIREDVCRAGGDAVLAEVNGQGHYVRGIVLRYRQQ